jgi:hypothetical protein
LRSLFAIDDKEKEPPVYPVTTPFPLAKPGDKVNVSKLADWDKTGVALRAAITAMKLIPYNRNMTLAPPRKTGD